MCIAYAANCAGFAPFPTHNRAQREARWTSHKIRLQQWASRPPGIGGGGLLMSSNNSPQSAEQVYSWIARHLPEGPRPQIVRPVNYVRIIVVTTTILGLITFLSVASRYILPVIQNRNLWAAISLITILLFTSGHMFNRIRKVPYVSGDGKGGINYFAGGFSNQFGLETQIVAAMCQSNATHAWKTADSIIC